MVTFDETRGVVIVRVVYDGPPLSGKTTSLRALASKLPGEVVTPAEADGRTLYFDWFDYVAGVYKGRPIHSQILSTPGQRSLDQRRQLLLETADSVVFVANTRKDAFDETLERLENIHGLLAREDGHRVGLVVQANHRDAPDAVPIEVVRDRVSRYTGVSVVESVATRGTGVRTAFVFGVQLAVGRAEESLVLRTETGDDPDALLDYMKQQELGSASMAALAEEFRSEPAAPAEDGVAAELDEDDEDDWLVGSDKGERAEEREETLEPPSLPSRSLGTGLIWPPVLGRVTLHRLHERQPTPILLPNGDVSCDPADDYEAYSYRQDVFADLSSARRALIAWARLHGRAADLSGERALALAPTGRGAYRLWQIRRVRRSLADTLEHILESDDPGQLAVGLVRLCLRLLRAHDQGRLRHLQYSPSTVSAEGDPPQYVGRMPQYDSAVGPGQAEPEEPVAFLRAQLQHVLEAWHATNPELVAPTLSAAASVSTGDPTVAAIVEAISAMLIGR